MNIYLHSKKCEYCGEPGAAFIPNPLDLEIKGIKTKHWICFQCEKDIEAEI